MVLERQPPVAAAHERFRKLKIGIRYYELKSRKRKLSHRELNGLCTVLFEIENQAKELGLATHELNYHIEREIGAITRRL